MILVDSSVYIDWLRLRRDPVKVLDVWLQAHRVLTCGVVRCEVLRGIRNARALERMTNLFDVLIDIPLDRQIWNATLQLARNLDSRGRVLPLTDLVIAASAMHWDALLITADRRFQEISHIRQQPDLPAIVS